MSAGGHERDLASSAAVRSGLAVALAAAIAAFAMLVLGDRAYNWIKAFHVIAVMSWMAGLLYLPRLFVYHCETLKGSAQAATFKLMERRLLLYIMTPAMIFSWVLGLWLAWAGHHWSEGWFHAKLALVVLLSGFQGYLSKSAAAFEADRNKKPASHWRLANEVPTVLMIGIVILVIVRPF